jgi:hypothetical protein
MRHLIVLLALLAWIAPGAHASDLGVASLDGGEFLEDEPLWLCGNPGDASAGADGWGAHPWRLVGHDAQGNAVDRVLDAVTDSVLVAAGAGGGVATRAYEFAQTFGFREPTGRWPLGGLSNGIPAGTYEVRAASGRGRALASFRVVPPRASERSVRDALARAARLSGPLGQPAEAAALYEAVVARYPRTTYRSAIYRGLWSVREHTRFAHDPGRWIEEVFAYFHDSCFGVAALDVWAVDVGPEAARPTLRRLVGIYPSSLMAAAAQHWL